MNFGKRLRFALLAGLAALASCSSFGFRAETFDLDRISTAYVLIAPRGEMVAQSEGQIRELVLPERLQTYPFFLQLEPDGAGGWRRIEVSGGALEPKLDGGLINLKVPKPWIEAHADHLIALVVRFTDRSWKWARDPLAPKADAEYVITQGELQPKR